MSERKSELDREFEEHERLAFAEQARMYRGLSDEERFEDFCTLCARFLAWVPALEEPAQRRLALVDGRAKDEALERMERALG